MGCDIHMYIEHKHNDSDYWQSWGGRINPGRSYWMFGLIAGVRREPKNRLSPKGLPENLGYASKNDNRLYISEDGNGEGEVTLEKALKWVNNGCVITYNNGKPTWVSHPDWHSHTWLTSKELEFCLDEFYKEVTEEGKFVEYEAVLVALKKFEECGEQARVIVWFNN